MKAASCLLVIFALTVPAGAGGPSLTPRDLDRLDRVQLDAIFAAGTAGEAPVGFARGHIVLRVDGRALRARLQLTLIALARELDRGLVGCQAPWAGWLARAP